MEVKKDATGARDPRSIYLPPQVLAAPGVGDIKTPDSSGTEEKLRAMAAFASTINFRYAAELLLYWLNGGGAGARMGEKKIVPANVFFDDKWFVRHFAERFLPQLIEVLRLGLRSGLIDPVQVNSQELPAQRWSVAASPRDSFELFLMAGKFNFTVRSFVACEEVAGSLVCRLVAINVTVDDVYDFDEGRFFGFRTAGLSVGFTSEELNALKQSSRARDFDWVSEVIPMHEKIPLVARSLIIPK